MDWAGLSAWGYQTGANQDRGSLLGALRHNIRLQKHQKAHSLKLTLASSHQIQRGRDNRLCRLVVKHHMLADRPPPSSFSQSGTEGSTNRNVYDVRKCQSKETYLFPRGPGHGTGGTCDVRARLLRESRLNGPFLQLLKRLNDRIRFQIRRPKPRANFMSYRSAANDRCRFLETLTLPRLSILFLRLSSLT